MSRVKKGFSIHYETKNDSSSCTVYFEEKVKDKVIYCFIYDAFHHYTFKAKAVCNNLDNFSKEQGYKLAFERCLEKRDKEYERLARREFKSTIALKNKNKNIEYKFNTFLKSITK